MVSKWKGESDKTLEMKLSEEDTSKAETGRKPGALCHR